MLNFPFVDNFPLLSLYVLFTAMTAFELARVFLHKNHFNFLKIPSVLANLFATFTNVEQLKETTRRDSVWIKNYTINNTVHYIFLSRLRTVFFFYIKNIFKNKLLMVIFRNRLIPQFCRLPTRGTQLAPVHKVGQQLIILLTAKSWLSPAFHPVLWKIFLQN